MIPRPRLPACLGLILLLAAGPYAPKVSAANPLQLFSANDITLDAGRNSQSSREDRRSLSTQWSVSTAKYRVSSLLYTLAIPPDPAVLYTGHP